VSESAEIMGGRNTTRSPDGDERDAGARDGDLRTGECDGSTMMF
jgi:hypothetical protein